MTPQRWNEVKALLAQALEAEGEARAALLAAAEPELAREASAFLALDTELGDFIERPVFDLHDRDDPAVRVGERLGPYRLARAIGSGGMGAVYQAVRDDDEFEQSVAIKVLKRGLDTAEVVHRFRTERQILAGLEHPHVARLIDGGTTPDGRPYLVMEYVEGRPIDVWCDERGLGVEQRLELFLAVCEAVKFAHRNLVVHRDLKPSNILVTDDGVPKLLDFGIARLLDPEGASALPTVGAWKFLTPEYASPEQVLGRPITTATDVYSLGVLLFQLLTDRRPYDLGERSAQGLAAALQAGEPPKPSQVTPEERRKRLRGDLDDIALTALRLEPERRYGTATELADDVRRHLDGLPVRATPDSWRYRAGKFVRRHRVGVGAATVIGVLLMAFAVMAGVLMQRAEDERDRAEEERERAERVVVLMQDIFGSADPDREGSEDITLTEVLDRSVQRVVVHQDDPEIRATLLHSVGKVYLKLGEFGKARRVLRESLTLRRQFLEPDDPLIADTVSALANTYRNRKQRYVAKSLLTYAVDLLASRFSADDPALLSVRNNLGTLNFRSQSYEEAARIHREVLAMRRRSAPLGSLKLAHSLHNLAAAQLRLDQPDEAAQLFSEAVVYRLQFGGESSEIAQSLNGLGSALQDLDRFGEARETFVSAERMLRSVNEKHPELPGILNNKGLVLQELGWLVEAEADLREAVSKRSDDPVMKRNLASVLVDRGKLEEAEQSIGLAKEQWVEKDGGWRLDDLESLRGEVLAARGRYAEAQPVLLDSYDRLTASESANRRNVQEALERIIRLYEAWGKDEAAAEWRAKRPPAALTIAPIDADTASM